MTALAVFPMNPVTAIARKGEIKPRYFNPSGAFERIQIIDPGSERPTDAVVRALCGDANYEIVLTGLTERMSWRNMPLLHRFLRGEVDRLTPTVAAFRPDIIRSYSTQIPGWIAVHVARRLAIPAVISVHANFDKDMRQLMLRTGNYRRYLANLWLRRIVERETIAGADLVIAAYQFTAEYARQFEPKRMEVLYNRVETDRFRPRPREDGPFTVLSVGRLDRERGNHGTLIKAIQGTDVQLRIVGDGDQRLQLQALAKRLGVDGQVVFRGSVPHERMHDEYAAADVYATATRQGGIQIPTIEAIASGLPLVLGTPKWEAEPELVADLAVVVDNTPAGFRTGFLRLHADPDRRRQLGARGRERALALDYRIAEAREADLYRSLLDGPAAG